MAFDFLCYIHGFILPAFLFAGKYPSPFIDVDVLCFHTTSFLRILNHFQNTIVSVISHPHILRLNT